MQLKIYPPMTDREKALFDDFAGRAMQGFVSNSSPHTPKQNLERYSYEVAALMIVERRKAYAELERDED